MTRTPLKLLAFASAAAVCLGTSYQAISQTVNLKASLITTSTITATKVTDMDFGKWLIRFKATDTPALTLTADNAVSVTQTGVVTAGSQLVNITPSANRGVINVTIPAAATLQMTRSNTVGFTDPGLSLNTVSFDTASSVPAAIANAGTGNVIVTAANTAEPVSFGGVINVTATPADATHTASFDITFSY